jgi:predicted O-methyltransferase YrrM
MSHEWSDVEKYYSDLLIGPDPALDAAMRAIAAAGLPKISVSPNEGKFLHLLAKISGARRILEIGALGGFSAIWLARALPKDGRLITLEAEAKHAAVAQSNIDRAGLSGIVEIITAPALQTLPRLASENRGPFDLFFIDADKAGTPDYFTWSLKLSRPGSVIVVDNVVRKGAVVDPKSPDRDVQGIRRFNDLLSKEKRVTATTIQTVGSKGYDGFTLAVVKE